MTCLSHTNCITAVGKNKEDLIPSEYLSCIFYQENIYFLFSSNFGVDASELQGNFKEMDSNVKVPFIVRSRQCCAAFLNDMGSIPWFMW